MKKVVFLTIAALFMFGCTKTSEYYVEKAETLTDVKSGCRSLTEINEIALKAAMNFMADGTKSNKVEQSSKDSVDNSLQRCIDKIF